MARNTTTTNTAGHHKRGGLFSGFRRRNNARVTTQSSTNPITGTHTTTKTTKTHPHGVGHHGHNAGHGPMASNATTHHTTATAPAHHHQRKPSVGDKVSGAMMKLRGSLTRRPGLKAAGTRRMRGTDGRGSHYTT